MRRGEIVYWGVLGLGDCGRRLFNWSECQFHVCIVGMGSLNEVKKN